MKQVYKVMCIVLCCAMMLSLPAMASSIGAVSGDSDLVLVGDRTVKATCTSTETQAAASDIFKIGAYGKVTVSMNWDEILFEFEKEKSGTKTVTAQDSAVGEDGYTYVSWGTHVTMYNSAVDPDYATSAAGPVDVFYNTRSSSTVAEDIAREGMIIQQVYDSTGVNLGDLSFVSFEYLWLRNGDELDPQYEPLKTLLIDEFILAKEGEGLPSGVYYDDNNAYLVRAIGNGGLRLVHSQIGSAATLSVAGEATGGDESGDRIFDGRTYSVVGTYDIK